MTYIKEPPGSEGQQPQLAAIVLNQDGHAIWWSADSLRDPEMLCRLVGVPADRALGYWPGARCLAGPGGYLYRTSLHGSGATALVLLSAVFGSTATAATVEPGFGDSLQTLVGASDALRAVKELTLRYAHTNAAVLVLGETGVGKEVVARAIHSLSPRARGPFVAINCSSIPEGLAETELFGYERGAFTGAAPGGHKGRFDQANGGTLFLDEMSEMPLSVQGKLLRALQEGEIDRVGGRRSVAVDVRVISATNRDLKAMVREGRFRADLYYRLNVLRLAIPPLRDRPEDIPVLVRHYLERSAAQLGLAPKHVAAAAMELLVRYGWPGNVRELINCVERLAILVSGPTIEPDEVRRVLGENNVDGEPASPDEAAGAQLSMEAMERLLIRRALERTGGNKVEAARLLGIHRSSLYEKIRRYGLSIGG